MALTVHGVKKTGQMCRVFQVKTLVGLRSKTSLTPIFHRPIEEAGSIFANWPIMSHFRRVRRGGLSLAVCFWEAARFRVVGRPFEWPGLAAVGFGPGVIRRDPAVPTALLPRLPDRSPPPRARENRHRAAPADSWSGWLVFSVDILFA